MPDQNDSLYKKLNLWMNTLDDLVTNLFEEQFIFAEFKKVVLTNSELNSNDFTHSIAVWYSSYMSVFVRKLADEDKKVISYGNLLNCLKNNPRIISRTRYLKEFGDVGCYSLEKANRDFDKYVGAENEFLNLSIIENEINELKSTISVLKKYVDQRVAHYQNTEFTDIPKFDDLDKSIEFLGDLHRKYYAIFRSWNWNGDTQSKEFSDWTSIFYKPWAKESNKI